MISTVAYSLGMILRAQAWTVAILASTLVGDRENREKAMTAVKAADEAATELLKLAEKGL